QLATLAISSTVSSVVFFSSVVLRHPLRSSLFPYTTLFRSLVAVDRQVIGRVVLAHRRLPQAGVVAAGALDLDDGRAQVGEHHRRDRKSTRLDSRHVSTSYAVLCFKKKRDTNDN